MAVKHLSESTEMYLKAMVELSERDTVTVARLAERLGVTPVSANEMVRRLGEQGLVSHMPYKGVNLTKKGREAAVNVLRRQRLWECFLHVHLNLEWAQIYEFACSLEHATAPEVTEALAAFLGDPKTCPRGNPIPSTDGSFKALEGIPLSELGIGEKARILAVDATATDVLRYLQERDIMPGRDVKLLEAAPLQGPLTLEVGGRVAALGVSMAEFVVVKPIKS